ncbi:MAG: hypothetical protein ACRD3J_30785, partial [Thermoanaerobaculia bacterium]
MTGRALELSPVTPGAQEIRDTPSLGHVLSPKIISARARPLGKPENKSGRIILFTLIGGVFWLFVFGLLYRLLRYFHGIPEIGAVLAAKLLGVMLVSLFG